MANAAQTRSMFPGTARARRLLGCGGGVVLASLLTLPAAAPADTTPAIHAPTPVAVASAPTPAALHAPAPAALVAGAPVVTAVAKSTPAAAKIAKASSVVATPDPHVTPAPPAGLHVTPGTPPGGPSTVSPPAGSPPKSSPPVKPVPAPVSKPELPRVSSLPAPAGRTLPSLSQPPATHDERSSKAAPAPANVPPSAPTARPVAAGPLAPSASAAHRRSARHGTPQGTGGVLAKAASVGRPVNGPGFATSAGVAHTAVTAPRQATASAPGFALISGAGASDFGSPASRPASLVSALAPFSAGPSLGGDGALAWLLLLCAGALLIGLLCVDAAGIGPRHDYLRRRQGRTWRPPPWH
ncbi:MAG: hypothetical protein JWM60_338 [Solirubrobacterales bacterium]|nr:hypothetical protein [Solirubrobacterales bacterium]